MEQNNVKGNTLSGKSIPEFAALLASAAPCPGGGGASALTGALAASLCSMVANLTLGRKKYADVAQDMHRIQTDASRLQTQLLQLIDEDAAGFVPLSAAYSIPKDDPAREEIMEKALLCACDAPMQMMRCCMETLALLEPLYQSGNRLLLSDVGVGAELVAAAISSASMNLFVNTASMQNGAAKQALEAEADEMLSVALPQAKQIRDNVLVTLRGKV